MSQIRWTLDELAEESTLHLNDAGDSKRIRWRPNGRQIRYYTTLGLLDRPFGGRGQKVSYGPKHLLQLLAIKRLQHQGLKLSEIQPVLAGLSAERLAELLGFSQAWLKAVEERLPEPEEKPRRDTNFWATVPAVPKSESLELRSCFQIELEPGVTLTLDQKRAAEMTPQQLQQLANDMARVWRNRT